MEWIIWLILAVGITFFLTLLFKNYTLEDLNILIRPQTCPKINFVPEVPHKEIINPFSSVEITSHLTALNSHSFRICVSCLASGHCTVLQNVDIDTFYKTLQLPHTEIMMTLQTFTVECFYLREKCGMQEICFNLSGFDDCPVDIRRVYPLVLIFEGDDPQSGTIEEATHSIHVIHVKLKDESPTELLYSFLKTNHNRLITLSRWFPTSEVTAGVTECVICRDAPAELVLMPCRHAALCCTCHQDLRSDLCPVCRRVVGYTFRVGEEASNSAAYAR